MSENYELVAVKSGRDCYEIYTVHWSS